MRYTDEETASHLVNFLLMSLLLLVQSQSVGCFLAFYNNLVRGSDAHQEENEVHQEENEVHHLGQYALIPDRFDVDLQYQWRFIPSAVIVGCFKKESVAAVRQVRICYAVACGIMPLAVMSFQSICKGIMCSGQVIGDAESQGYGILVMFK